jgi:DnaJ-class molecular chaperone
VSGSSGDDQGEGDGRAISVESLCPHCDGRGDQHGVRCPICGGTGRLIDIVDGPDPKARS